MLKVIWAAILVSLVLLAPASLHAAKAPQPAKADQKQPPMKVVLVRASNADCALICPEWIAAEGQIMPDTPAAFARIFKEIGTRNVPVFIHSGGGAVDAALEIGRMLRQRHAEVVVMKTVFEGCDIGDPKCVPPKGGVLRGRPYVGYGYCASACPFLVAGGERRFMPFGTVIGVHQVTNHRVLVQREYRIQYREVNGQRQEVSRQLLRTIRVGEENATPSLKAEPYGQMRKYLAEMGVDVKLVEISYESPPDRIRVLRPLEMEQLRLATDPIAELSLYRWRDAGSLWTPAYSEWSAPVARDPAETALSPALRHWAKAIGGAGGNGAASGGSETQADAQARFQKATEALVAKLPGPGVSAVSGRPDYSRMLIPRRATVATTVALGIWNGRDISARLVFRGSDVPGQMIWQVTALHGTDPIGTTMSACNLEVWNSSGHLLSLDCQDRVADRTVSVEDVCRLTVVPSIWVSMTTIDWAGKSDAKFTRRLDGLAAYGNELAERCRGTSPAIPVAATPPANRVRATTADLDRAEVPVAHAASARIAFGRQGDHSYAALLTLRGGIGAGELTLDTILTADNGGEAPKLAGCQIALSTARGTHLRVNCEDPSSSQTVRLADFCRIETAASAGAALSGEDRATGGSVNLARISAIIDWKDEGLARHCYAAPPLASAQ